MNIFITGGSKGIGRAIAEKFAKEGHTVIFTYYHHQEAAKELCQLYKNVFAYPCEMQNDKQCLETANEVLSQFEYIDVLINNVGMTKDKTFIKMEKETWDEVIDINLKALYHFTHAFLSKMMERNFGRIINISSVAGQKGAFGKTNYSAAKAGVIGFTKALALEVADKKITVNAVSPGMIETDMIKDIPQKYLERIKETIPMKGFGHSEDIADMVYYLSQSASSYITGQVIAINGGMYL